MMIIFYNIIIKIIKKSTLHPHSPYIHPILRSNAKNSDKMN